MQKPTDRTKGSSGNATTAIMPPGAISAEPKLEEPANLAPRRVLGMRVEVLPSKDDIKAEKPFPFRSAEEYANLEKNPVLNIIRRALDKTVVKVVAIAGAIAAPFVQIGLKDLGLYSYFSQQVENFSNVFSGIYEYSSGILLGFAALVTTVALSIPFVSNEPREKEIFEREQGHPSEEVRKAHKSARRKEEAFRMISKFRGASLLVAIPLAASDFWAYASGGFKGATEFVQGMSISAQAAIGAFLALGISSFISAQIHNGAVKTAGEKEYAYNLAKQEADDAEAKGGKTENLAAANAAESAAIIAPLDKSAVASLVCAAESVASLGTLSNVVDLSGKRLNVQPKTEEEAITLEQLISALDQRDIAVSTLTSNIQVLGERLQRAQYVAAADRKKLESLEAASAPLEGIQSLKDALDAKEAEIKKTEQALAGLSGQVKSLGGERDILAKEKERISRERDGFERNSEEKERLLVLATGLLSEREKELKELKAQLAAAKSAKPGPAAAPVSAVIQVPAPAVAQAPAEPVAAKEAPAPKEESVSLGAAPVAPAAAPEPLRGSPSEGGLPATVTDSSSVASSEESEDYRPSGPAVSV